jgi:hypothetical protein
MFLVAGLLSVNGCSSGGSTSTGGGGTTTNPQLMLSATSLTFASTITGMSSPAQTITVTNTGTAALTISSITASGDFSQQSTGCTGASIAIAGTCQVQVMFTPTAAGTRTGSLSFASNAPSSPQTVALTGTATAATPTLSLSATTLTFPTILTGVSSSAQTITVTNTGTAALTISSITISGDFSQQSAGCNGVSIAIAGTCQVQVTFTPTAAGTRTGSLSFASNAPSSPQTVALTGAATLSMPMLSLSATAVTFGTITTGMSSAPWMITATNVGVGPLKLSNIAISGDFSQSSGGCVVALEQNASCQIGVTFSPAVAGSRSGTLMVANNSASGPQSVTLSGTGAAAVSAAGQPIQVTAQAGAKPIAGASVQLFAAGTAGNGSTPTSLLAAALTTSASGVASIPAGYICPSASSQLYLVSRGGTVTGTTGANSNIALMTALGACGSIVSGAKYIVDEATTIAAVYALGPFYSAGGNIGATASNSIGLSNAFATAASLTDPVTGTSPGSMLPANAASPAARVNSLANILNACVGSASACSALYSATAQGTTPATNTLDAAYYLARRPAQNVSTLYAQSLTSSAYSPVLAASPIDWTMFLNFSGGGMDSPSGIGVDSQGSVWVSSYFNVASKFTPIGTPVFASGITGAGLNNSYGLAIDLSDEVWIPNEQPFTSAGIGSTSELSSTGASLAGNGYVNGGMNYPLAVAIDPNQTVWVVDYGNSHVTLLNSSGTPLSGASGYTTPLFAFPVAVAIDANHFGWIVNQSSNDVTKVAPDGSSFTNYNCCDLASGIAIDQGDNIWVANYFGDSVSLMTNAGTVISSSYTGLGSIYHPQGIALDGGGTVWVANYRAPYLTELSGATSTVPGTSLSPAAGLGADAGLLEAYALALDACGNIWVTNQGSNTVTKYIGLSVPVKTPLSGLPQLP